MPGSKSWLSVSDEIMPIKFMLEKFMSDAEKMSVGEFLVRIIMSGDVFNTKFS